MGVLREYSVIVPAGGTTHVGVNFDTATLVGVETPAALTSTSVAIQGSSDNISFVPLVDATGNAVTLTTLTSTARRHYLLPGTTTCCQIIRLVCGSSEASARTFKIFARYID